jgi:hypothetical protein
MKTAILLVALLLSTSEATAAVSSRSAPDRQARLELAASEPELIATANFADKLVRPDESIEVLLSRALNEAEERVAVLIGSTDVTGLFTQEKLRLRYYAKLWQLPPGESPVTVYLVSKDDKWKEIAQFTLRVRKEKDSRQSEKAESTLNELDLRADFIKDSAPGSGPSAALEAEMAGAEGGDRGQQPAPSPQPSASKNRKMKFTPSLTLTFPSQPAQSTFPEPQPERATFIEVNMQASLKNEATYGILNTQSSFDFAGSSFEKEALRFGTEGNAAPKVDL